MIPGNFQKPFSARRVQRLQDGDPEVLLRRGGVVQDGAADDVHVVQRCLARLRPPLLPHDGVGSGIWLSGQAAIWPVNETFFLLFS